MRPASPLIPTARLAREGPQTRRRRRDLEAIRHPVLATKVLTLSRMGAPGTATSLIELLEIGLPTVRDEQWEHASGSSAGGVLLL
jgi:hypothetical protein